MAERASMPTFVPRTVASFERAATVVARRVAAPVRMLATRALSFADRLVGTWAGASPTVGGLEGGTRAPMLAAARGGSSLPLPRPWYEVESDEDAIWPQQAARAAMAAATARATAGGVTAAASAGAMSAPTAATTSTTSTTRPKP